MRSSLLGLLVIAMTGCAYLTTYTRGIDLNGKSIAMDVKQRVIFGQKRFDEAHPTDVARNWNVICAEPSPDALTVLSATGGISATNAQTQTAANATGALAESGASIGLRTQSIQLLRDAMYRLCEGYASGAIGPEDYVMMQRRFQSAMMGLIAIEQLTGPVVAGQALLNTSAASQAGAGAGDAAVTSAQTALKTAKDDELTAKATLDTANSNYDKARKDVADNQKKIDVEKAKEKPDADSLKSLNDAMPGLRDAQTTADNARKDAQRRAEASTQAVKDAQASLAAAQSRASSSASGSGTLLSVATTSAQMQENLGKTVEAIVSSINTAYERDDCLGLMRGLVNNPERLRQVENASAVPIATQSPSLSPAAPQPERVSAIKTALGTCGQILEYAEKQVALQNQAMEARFSRTEAGDSLRAYWKPGGTTVDPDHETKLKQWMRDNGLNADAGSITVFLRNADFESLRLKAAKDLGVLRTQ